MVKNFIANYKAGAPLRILQSVIKENVVYKESLMTLSGQCTDRRRVIVIKVQSYRSRAKNALCKHNCPR